MNWKWPIILILMLILVIFTTQNYEVVEIKFLIWSFRTSRAIVIFATLITGIFIGWLTAFIKKR